MSAYFYYSFYFKEEYIRGIILCRSHVSDLPDTQKEGSVSFKESYFSHCCIAKRKSDGYMSTFSKTGKRLKVKSEKKYKRH